MKPAGRLPERGFALLIVLWTVTLLALLGSTITAAGRFEARIAANMEAIANAQAAADGAVAVAAFHLLDGSDAHWDPGGAARAITIGDAEVTLALRDERGRIDPNDAPSGLLAALLRRMGVADTTADALGVAITDWRVANDTGLGSSYRGSGRPYGPPHEPYQTLDELNLVLGMTPQILRQLRPHISLFIEQTPDPARADPIVAGAIADAVKRDQLTLNDGEQPGPLIVTVTATAHARGAVFTRIALLRMNGVADQPYEVLDWGGG